MNSKFFKRQALAKIPFINNLRSYMKYNLNCKKMLKLTEWNMHYTVLQSRWNIVNCLKYLTSYSLPLVTQHQIGRFLYNRDTFMKSQPNRQFWRLCCIINNGDSPCYNIKGIFKYSFGFLDISNFTGLHTLGTCIFQDHNISIYLMTTNIPIKSRSSHSWVCALWFHLFLLELLWQPSW